MTPDGGHGSIGATPRPEPDILTVHAIGSPRLGGAERFLARLTGALSKRGHPTVAVLRKGADLAAVLDPGVEVVETGMRNGLDVATWWAVRRLIQGREPDIVQTYLGRASRLTRVPRRSATVHVARLGGYYRPNAYRHADLWVGNTRGICDHLVRSGFPSERVHHVTNFVERVEGAESRPGAPRPRGGTDVPDDALLIFALGRFIPKKGFSELVEAFGRLPAEVDGRPVHLAMAGDGPLRTELEATARRLGVAERVSWPGWLTDPGPWLGAADVFVCPSRDEPLGNVVLEAWSHALPVVATSTAGPVELVSDGEDGVLVDIGSPTALAGALLRLLGDEGERQRLARAGLETVRRRHSVGAVVERYLELYRNATRRG